MAVPVWELDRDEAPDDRQRSGEVAVVQRSRVAMLIGALLLVLAIGNWLYWGAEGGGWASLPYVPKPA